MHGALTVIRRPFAEHHLRYCLAPVLRLQLTEMVTEELLEVMLIGLAERVDVP